MPQRVGKVILEDYDTDEKPPKLPTITLASLIYGTVVCIPTMIVIGLSLGGVAFDRRMSNQPTLTKGVLAGGFVITFFGFLSTLLSVMKILKRPQLFGYLGAALMLIGTNMIIASVTKRLYVSDA